MQFISNNYYLEWCLITMEDNSSLQIIYQNKGKTIDAHNLSYQQLKSKLNNALKLSPHYYYRLAYFDPEKDLITIQNQQQFRIFMHQDVPKKLYLDRINDSESHWQKMPRKKTRPKSPDYQQIFKAKKREIEQKLHISKERITQEINKQVEIGVKAILKEGQIHYGFVCSRCKMGPIEGSRFECIRCSYNICRYCQEEDDHIHPLIKVRSEKQTLKSKRNTLFYDDQDLRYILKERKKSRQAL